MYLILILLIVVILLVYVFKNTIYEKFTSNIPNNPSDYSCYNYIKNNKNWNLNELSTDQKKVLFTLKAGQTDTYDSDSLEFPYTNSCIIPANHYDIFNIRQKSDNTIDVNIDKTLTKDKSYNPRKTSYNLPLTSSRDYPVGVKINLDDQNMTFDNFKDILNGLYQQYDDEYIKNRAILTKQIADLDKYYDDLVVRYTNTVNDTNGIQAKINTLIDSNSECSRNIASLPSYLNRKEIYDNYNSYLSQRISNVITQTELLNNKQNELQNC
jgi:hypothetical protein